MNSILVLLRHIVLYSNNEPSKYPRIDFVKAKNPSNSLCVMKSCNRPRDNPIMIATNLPLIIAIYVRSNRKKSGFIGFPEIVITGKYACSKITIINVNK